MKDCQAKLCECAQPFPDSCCLLLLFLIFLLVNSGKALEKTVWDLRDLLMIAGARSSPKFYFYFYFVRLRLRLRACASDDVLVAHEVHHEHATALPLPKMPKRHVITRQSHEGTFFIIGGCSLVALSRNVGKGQHAPGGAVASVRR